MAENEQAEALKRAHDAAYNLLTGQFDLGGAFLAGSESQRRFASDFAFGYVFGFIDALLRVAGITKAAETITEMAVAYARLFGAEQGPRILGEALLLREHVEFSAARLLGAQEVRAWLSQTDNEAPVGLVLYLGRPVNNSD